MNEERAFSMLESYGVSRERAKSVATGIGVLATRYEKEIELWKFACAAHEERANIYQEAWEARHSYGHKQGITSPQAERFRRAEAKVKEYREGKKEATNGKDS